MTGLRTWIVLMKIFVVSNTMSQTPPRRDVIIDKQFGTITDTPLKKSETVGSVYLSDDWQKGDVFAKKGSLGVDIMKGIQLKLNLQDNALDIQTSGGIKTLKAAQIDSFTWINSDGVKERFENGDLFEKDGSSLKGFGKIISEGKVTLLSFNFVEIQRANYNPALSIGNTGDKIIKKTKLYFLDNSRLRACNRKSVKEILNLKQDKMNAFVRDKDIDLKELNDLKLLVDFYNSSELP